MGQVLNFKCYVTQWGVGRAEGYTDPLILLAFVTKVHGPTLSALRGGGWVSNLQKKALRNT